MKILLYLCAFTLFIITIPVSVYSSSGYVDFPSYFNSHDTSRVYTEFGYSAIDRNGAYLYSSTIGGRIDERISGSFSADYFSVRRADRIVFGFGDFTLNLNFRAAGDSTGSSGVFLRTDVRFPSGALSLRPFASRSFDGGGGVELRQEAWIFSLKLAGIYMFAGERNAEGPYPHSNYTVAAGSVNVGIGPLAAFISGYGVYYRKSGERAVLVSGVSGRVSDDIRITLLGSFETGEEFERQYDSLLSVRVTYTFPPLP